jgi:subtilase family serine protease
MNRRRLAATLLSFALALGSGPSLLAAGGSSFSPWIGALTFWRADLFVSGHALIDYGSQFALGFSVKNGGFAASGDFQVRVFTGRSYTTIQYAGLLPGESRFLWLVLAKETHPSGTVKTFHVDALDEVAESQEGNNAYSVVLP